MMNVRKLDTLWEAIPAIDLKRIGVEFDFSRPDDQLILRAINRTHPELVGALPLEWDVTAVNGAEGQYAKSRTKYTEEETLRELKHVGMLHFNGGGTSDKAYFKTHKLITHHKKKYYHTYGLVKYYVNMPWTWARFMVESKRRESVSYSPLVVGASV